MPPIEYREIKKKGYVHKLLGFEIKENAFIELQNLISGNKGNLTGISINDVLQIENRYYINFNKSFKKGRKKIFHRFVEHYILHELDQKAINELKHLSALLKLRNSDCRKELSYLCAQLYFTKVKKLLKHGELDYDEQVRTRSLKQLCDSLI